MCQQDFGEDQVAVRRLSRIGLDLRHPTLEHHRCAGHSRWRHAQRSLAGDTTVFELADLRTEQRGRGVHRLGKGKGHQLDHQFAGITRIAQTVLEAAVVTTADVDHQGRRLIADHLEEAERRQVVDALGRARGDPCNGPRRDGRSQPAVGFQRTQLGEIEQHLQRPARDSRI